jgi:hypothetical protein
MEWQAASERPTPDAWFVRELKKIDPDLRVVWGMERYLKTEWAIERKTPAERYFLMYEAILSDAGPRFVEQPVYDCSKKLYDEGGSFIGYEQVGTRTYDLAPEYEWVAFRTELNQALLDRIKQLYWERDHQKEVEQQAAAEKDKKAETFDNKLNDSIAEGIEEGFRANRQEVVFGHGPTRSENQ